MKGVIAEIDAMTAMRFVLPRHYSGRRPTISRAFGWYRNKSLNYSDLVAVCTFGKPATPSLCTGICGEQYAQNVYELNRLCRSEDWNEQLSQFVSACLRRLRTSNWIVVSYSDTAMHHHGYIYQACNFLYTGCTAERTDKFVGGGATLKALQKLATDRAEIGSKRKAPICILLYIQPEIEGAMETRIEVSRPSLSEGRQRPRLRAGLYFATNYRSGQKVQTDSARRKCRGRYVRSVLPVLRKETIPIKSAVEGR